MVSDILSTDPTSVLDGPTGASTPAPATAPRLLVEDGQPTGVDVTGLRKPKKLQVYQLREGTGPVLDGPHRIAADYLGQVWGEKTPFNDSYPKEPVNFTVGMSRRHPGLGQGARRGQGRCSGDAGRSAERGVRRRRRRARSRPTPPWSSSSTSSASAEREESRGHGEVGTTAQPGDPAPGGAQLHHQGADPGPDGALPGQQRRGLRPDVRARQGRPPGAGHPARGRLRRQVLRGRAGLPDQEGRLRAPGDRLQCRRGRRARAGRPGLAARRPRRGHLGRPDEAEGRRPELRPRAARPRPADPRAPGPRLRAAVAGHRAPHPGAVRLQPRGPA